MILLESYLNIISEETFTIIESFDIKSVYKKYKNAFDFNLKKAKAKAKELNINVQELEKESKHLSKLIKKLIDKKRPAKEIGKIVSNKSKTILTSLNNKYSSKNVYDDNAKISLIMIAMLVLFLSTFHFLLSWFNFSFPFASLILIIPCAFLDELFKRSAILGGFGFRYVGILSGLVFIAEYLSSLAKFISLPAALFASFLYAGVRFFTTWFQKNEIEVPEGKSKYSYIISVILNITMRMILLLYIPYAAIS